MSPAEVVWRVKSLARDVVDRYRVSLKAYPGKETAGVTHWQTSFSILQPREGGGTSYPSEWCLSLVKRADALLAHRFSFFRFEEEDFGNPIDWHFDYNLRVRAPLSYAPSIDYRNAHEAGDCKLVWEHNRHQHLVVLARAYQVTGNKKYAEEIVSQIASWLEANPYGYGMNWRSPMEQGIRLINWVWALDYIAESKLMSSVVHADILHSIYLHCWDTRRKYSQGSSANNHLIGEAAGVFVATAYFSNMPNGEQWCREAREILEREIYAQTYDSGCSKEHTFGYPYFVIQFFLICGLVGRWSGNDFSDAYWSRLEKMIEFMGRLVQGGEHVPMIGDADDGYVLDLDDGRRDYRYILAVGAVLFERSDFKAWAGGDFSESAYWLLGRDSRFSFDRVKVEDDSQLTSIAFRDAGYYLLQSGTQGQGISVLMDCAELGYGPIAAHGHADALSIVVRAYGKDFLVDPGTYDYYTYPQWRDYFRSTFAHNTVTVDGEDQSEMQGRFLWGKRANSRLVSWHTSDIETSIVAEHDGYQRLVDGVIHRRTVHLDHNTFSIRVCDEIKAGAEHEISLQFQLSELCSIESLENSSCHVEFSGHKAEICFDDRLELDIYEGSESPMAGWVSRGYHRKLAAPMVVAKLSTRGGVEKIETIIKFPI